MSQVQVRRRKAEVLPELPPKPVIELPLELTDAQRAATVQRYLCQDTAAQRIDEIIRRKRDLFDEIVDPATLDPARFTRAELLRIAGWPAGGPDGGRSKPRRRQG